MVQIKELVIFNLFLIVHLTGVLFWEISWQMLDFIFCLAVCARIVTSQVPFLFLFLTRVMFTGENKCGVPYEILRYILC